MLLVGLLSGPLTVRSTCRGAYPPVLLDAATEYGDPCTRGPFALSDRA